MLFNTILGIESMAIVTKSIGSVDYRKYSEEDFLSKLDLGSELFNEDLIQTQTAQKNELKNENLKESKKDTGKKEDLKKEKK